MKVTVTPKEQDSALPFPKLMVSEGGDVVLFQEPKCGMVIKSVEPMGNRVGRYLKNCCMPAFQDFHGTITIEQE